MLERLNLAQRLMSYKGAIFISVVENKFAQIKLICNDFYQK